MSNIFDKEQRNLLIVLFCFMLTFLLRFLWDVYDLWIPLDDNLEGDLFTFLVVNDLMAILDGMAFFALLILHWQSFKTHANYNQSSNPRNNSQSMNSS